MNQLIEKLTDRSQQEISSLFSSIKFLRVYLDWVLKERIGEIWVDNVENTKVALLTTKSISYIVGDIKSEAFSELLEKIPTPNGIIYPNSDWKEALKKKLHPKLSFMTRANLSSDSLDIEHVKSLKRTPEGFELQEIDKETVEQNKEKVIHTIGQLAGYDTVQSYIKNGIGFCIKHNRKVVSAAYSAHPFEREFEIDVWTEDEYRRKGLATAACAALIEYSLENGLIPHWDAQDERSVNLALKLGYSNPERYEMAVKLP